MDKTSEDLLAFGEGPNNRRRILDTVSKHTRQTRLYAAENQVMESSKKGVPKKRKLNTDSGLHEYPSPDLPRTVTEQAARRNPANIMSSQHSPLAEKMRPSSLNDFVGQEQVMGTCRTLRRIIESDDVSSFILWGPPGCGKTTIAYIISKTTKHRFVKLSAVAAGVADIRKVVSEATGSLLGLQQKRTILFLDEIHRFNKAQQDALLPHVERGTIILIGATTENPSFEVNSALLSRCRVFVLHSLTVSDIKQLLTAAAVRLEFDVDSAVLTRIAERADGDGRVALNQLELCVSFASWIASDVPEPIPILDELEEASNMRESPKRLKVTPEILEEAFSKKSHLMYDKAGDQHYNLISALQKSVRGSDKDAAVYYLARMLEAGEDPLYIARRVVRMATEDIGLGNHQALPLCVAAYQACHFTGMPECSTALTLAVCHLCDCPKSNAIEIAYLNAKNLVSELPDAPVPYHLRNAPTRLMRQLGYHKDYVYTNQPAILKKEQQLNPAQSYLPEALRGAVIFPHMSNSAEFQATRELNDQQPSI